MLFLMKSIPVGALIGVIFSAINGMERKRVSCFRLFIADVLFFILSALITFFASLVIMDGHLHPILFGGLVIGFSFVHFLCGRHIAWFIRTAGNGCKSLLNLAKRMPMNRPFKRRIMSDTSSDNSDIAIKHKK